MYIYEDNIKTISTMIPTQICTTQSPVIIYPHEKWGKNIVILALSRLHPFVGIWKQD